MPVGKYVGITKFLKHLKELVLNVYYTFTSCWEISVFKLNLIFVFILCSLSFHVHIVDERFLFCFVLAISFKQVYLLTSIIHKVKFHTKFRQSSIVFEKPGTLSEYWKLWRAPTTTELNISIEILHTFPTYQSHQCFCLELAKKNVARKAGFFFIFVNNSSAKQNEKKSKHLFVDIFK